LPLGERSGYWHELTNFTVQGALEGERLKVLACTGGNPHEQEMSVFGEDWSNAAHLWWVQAKPGDKLDLVVPVQSAGKYNLALQMTKARDYGIVQLYLDSQKLGRPIDLYHTAVVATGPLEMGVHDLTAGEHKLTIEVVGANPKAIKAYMAALDYVKLDPAR
jgi:hypothetical protein